MTLELAKPTAKIRQRAIPVNIEFLEFLIDLYDIVSKAPADKIDTHDAHSFKAFFPIFKQVNDLYINLSLSVVNFFSLKCSYLYHLEKKFKKLFYYNKKLVKIRVSFGSKHNHTTHYLMNYRREFYDKLSNILKRDYEKLVILGRDQFLLQFNNHVLSCFDVLQQDAETNYTMYQLVLQFLHFSNWLTTPISFFHVIYYHFKHISSNNYLKRPADLSTNIAMYRKTNKELLEKIAMTDKISYLPPTQKDTNFPVISSKTKIALQEAKKNYYSSINQSIISNNSVIPKLHQIGLKYFLVELPPIKSLKNIAIPNYVIEIMRFKDRTIIIGVTSNSHGHYIRRKIIKINKLSVSRSLSIYLLNKVFDLNLQKQDGIFPAFNKEFCFLNLKNHLKRYLRADPSLYDYILNNWEYGIYENTFSQFIDNNDLFEIEKIVNENDLEQSIHKRPLSSLLTNLPLHLNHMKEIFVYVVYISFIAYNEAENSLYTQKDIHSIGIQEIRDFIQIWGDRAQTWETSNQLFCTVAFPSKMPGFVLALKKKLDDLKEIWDLGYEFRYEIFDRKTFITNDRRYRNQISHPSFKYLNPDTGEWKLPCPNISLIKKDFGF